MTSQGYNNSDELLFPLKNWKQSHRIKCSDQLTVNKRDTDCLEHLHTENTKPSVNVNVSHAQPQLYYGFYRMEGRSDGMLIELDRDVVVLVTVFTPSRFGRKDWC